MVILCVEKKTNLQVPFEKTNTLNMHAIKGGKMPWIGRVGL